MSTLGVGALIEALECDYAARGHSKQTLKNHTRMLRAVGHPDEATLGDLLAFIQIGRTQGTRATYAASILSVFKTLRRLGLIHSTLDQQLPKIPAPKRVPRPAAETDLLTVMRRGRSPMREWVILSAFTGLRAMEISRLQGRDVTCGPDGEPMLRVHGKGRAGGVVDVVPLHPVALKVIRDKGNQGRLWEYCPSKVSTMVGRELRRLGLDGISLHSFRHRFATVALQASGWDLLTVSRLMRHAKIESTIGYTQLRLDRPREVVLLVPNPADLHHSPSTMAAMSMT